jgi:hypothetical protein
MNQHVAPAHTTGIYIRPILDRLQFVESESTRLCTYSLLTKSRPERKQDKERGQVHLLNQQFQHTATTFTYLTPPVFINAGGSSFAAKFSIVGDLPETSLDNPNPRELLLGRDGPCERCHSYFSVLKFLHRIIVTRADKFI